MSELASRFATWEATPPPDLDGDPMWRLPAFRLATFMAIVCRDDESILRRSARSLASIEQLAESVDSIGANIAEGYGRLSGKERARFYEFAMASAREAREWYRRVSPPLTQDAAADRRAMLSRVIKILAVAIPQERAGSSERRIRRSQRRSRKEPPRAT